MSTLPGLTELSLAHNPFDDEGVEALFREGFFPSLARLDLRGTQVTQEAIDGLRDKGLIPSLQTCLIDRAG